MAKKNFVLTLYQISINVRGDKDKQLVLSDFASGIDFLTIINNLLNSWKYKVVDDNTENQNIQNDEENLKVFRIMKGDSSDILHSTGRFVSGIIESGNYGTEENIVNIKTGKPVHTKHTYESVLVPFYFLFYIPENSSVGFLILERIGIDGIYSIIERKLKEFIAPKLDTDCILRIKPLVLKNLVAEHLKDVTGGASRIILEEVRKEDLKVSKLSTGNISDKDIRSTDLVFNAKRGKRFDITKWFDNLLLKKNHAEFYIVDDVEYKDICFDLKIQGKNRKVSIKEIEKLGTYIEITDNVILANNKYPTYASIHKEANKVLSYIIEQFGYDKK